MVVLGFGEEIESPNPNPDRINNPQIPIIEHIGRVYVRYGRMVVSCMEAIDSPQERLRQRELARKNRCRT
jgi:hypothetical protein